MLWFFFALFFVVAGLIWVAVVPKTRYVVAGRDGQGRPVHTPAGSGYRRYSLVFFIIALLFVLLSTMATVGTRNTGVATVFNKPTGKTYDAGLVFKAPWVAVTDIDSSVQPESFTNDRAVRVKIGDGGTAGAWVAVRWRINPDKADTVFQDYRNSEDNINDAVRASVFTPNFMSAVNEVFGSYDPLAESSAALANPDITPEELAKLSINVNPDYSDFANKIKKASQSNIDDEGSLVQILSVNVTFLDLPGQTQDRINRFNAAVQDTKIAAQEVATKDQQAQANNKLAASLQDPNVLVSKCLDGLIAGDFSNQPGFSCWQGGGGGVVIPGVAR